MRGGQWLTLCSYYPCALLLLVCSTPAKSNWSPWSDTDCYLQPDSDGKSCIARQLRTCECREPFPSCECTTRSTRYIQPPGSSRYCTSDCEAVGTWCSWSQWYQAEGSSCSVTVVERTRKCCEGSTGVSIDLHRCEKLGISNSMERHLRYAYNCATSPMGRLTGIFGTVFVIICVLAVIVFLRMRSRKRHLRIMAQRNRIAQMNEANVDPLYIIANPTDDPYADIRAPVLPPRYDEVQPLPPPPPYELTVSPNAQSNTNPNNPRSEA